MRSASSASLLYRRPSAPGGCFPNAVGRGADGPSARRRIDGDRGTRLEDGPPPRVEVLPGHIRLLQRRQLLDDTGAQRRHVARSYASERLQAETKRIELDVAEGV